MYSTEYTDWFSAEVQDPPNECPGYDTKQFDIEASVMLGLCGMWSTPLLPLHQLPYTHLYRCDDDLGSLSRC